MYTAGTHRTQQMSLPRSSILSAQPTILKPPVIKENGQYPELENPEQIIIKDYDGVNPEQTYDKKSAAPV